MIDIIAVLTENGVNLENPKTEEIHTPVYELHITSWENDGDYYNTEILKFGLDDVPSMLKWLNILLPQIGNNEGSYYTEDSEVTSFIDAIVGITEYGNVRVLESVKLKVYSSDNTVTTYYCTSAQ